MEPKKRKLLVTASTFPRWEGDTEPRFILDLARNLTKEYDVTVLVPAAVGAKDKEVLEGVKVIRYHYFPVHRWETLCYPGAIVPRIREKKIRILLVPCLFIGLWGKLCQILPEYDIVHAHWLLPQGIVQSFFRKPYIVTGHGGDVTSLNKGILKTLKRRALRHAQGVTVVSRYLKGRVEEIAPGCRPKVISMGVDTAKFGRQYFQENYFGQGDKKVVLFVGRLAEKKGVTYLIEAMKEMTTAMLVIVGDGPLREQLMRQAKELEETKQVKILFLGAKTHEELRAIYASADVFAAPSITAHDGDQEGVPTTIMEAMASGLPVVASDSSGIREIIEDGVSGLLCEEKNVRQLADNIRAVLMDDHLRKKLLEGAEETIERFDYRNIAAGYGKLLESVGKMKTRKSDRRRESLGTVSPPLVSVIIPVYNVEAYMDKCMESVLHQTYSNLEIILVDDGSTDASGKKCDTYAIKDKRVKVLHKTNGGLSDARNAGLDNMTGDYVVFVDSDDYVDKRMIERLVGYAMAGHCDLVAGGHVKTVAETEDKRNDIAGEPGKTISSDTAIRRMLYKKGFSAYAPGKLYRAGLFKEIRFPVGKLFEDIITTYHILKISDRVGLVEYPMYYYRQRGGSIVNLSYNSARLDEVYHAMDILEDAGDNGKLRKAAEAYLFFALMDNYVSLDKSYGQDRIFLENNIRKYRGRVVKNPCAGRLLRVMAAVTYFPGMGCARFCGRIYKIRNQRKWLHVKNKGNRREK